MSKTISELQQECYQTALSKGWYDKGEPSVGERLMLMVTELAEAMEDFRDGFPLDKLHFEEDGKPCGVPSELADVIIRIFDFCGRNNINLEEAILKKMEYNSTRSYRHGNKKA